ncbi:hypothetical protein K443DRAFT_14777 [Laccaria amethystina LaAM-08-1]|uniref:Uncharacterized protein n=1 Tax=Laccaria amethystina LaAM-08-1 TaxID=1095629 RepID=A0A0C9X0A6_9AGAR|nr:hypothetical protein K443DRAFT_14777 [Laccaria amethystina LaAM-08-1]
MGLQSDRIVPKQCNPYRVHTDSAAPAESSAPTGMWNFGTLGICFCDFYKAGCNSGYRGFKKKAESIGDPDRDIPIDL